MFTGYLKIFSQCAGTCIYYNTIAALSKHSHRWELFAFQAFDVSISSHILIIDKIYCGDCFWKDIEVCHEVDYKLLSY